MPKFWIADDKTDVENGWTIYTNHPIGSKEFWAACDAEFPPFSNEEETFRISKAVELDEDGNWVGNLGQEIVSR